MGEEEGLIAMEQKMIQYDRVRHISASIQKIRFLSGHMHGSFELGYILEESAQYHQGSNTRTVHPGSIILANPYEQHGYASLGENPVVVLTVHIHRLFVRHYVESLSRVKFCSDQIANLSQNEHDALVKLLFQIANAYFGDSESQQYDVTGNAVLLMGKLFSSLECVVENHLDSTDKELQNGRMQRLVSYIDENYRQKITLSTLADMEGITPTYLSHFFKKAFGVSFQSYLNTRRFEKALLLMRDKSMSKVDICMDCGFSESRYLEAACQKTFGCSVAEYRKLCEKMEEVNITATNELLHKEMGRKESMSILQKYLETNPHD